MRLSITTTNFLPAFFNILEKPNLKKVSNNLLVYTFNKKTTKSMIQIKTLVLKKIHLKYNLQCLKQFYVFL